MLGVLIAILVVGIGVYQVYPTIGSMIFGGLITVVCIIVLGFLVICNEMLSGGPRS